LAAAAGRLRVIDYKTGKSQDYRGLTPDDPDQRGTRLQLPVYGLAARALLGDDQAPVAAEYWFLSETGPLEEIGYEVTPDVLSRAGATLVAIVDGIEAGAFPARPTETSTDPWVRCRFCNPDGLGVSERKREWERKRADPAQESYAHLAEGASQTCEQTA
jgi:ATP-dependent helicase/nuclease subunit B